MPASWGRARGGAWLRQEAEGAGGRGQGIPVPNWEERESRTVSAIHSIYGNVCDQDGTTPGCSCSCPLTGDLTSSACVCGCVVNGVSATAATSVYYYTIAHVYCSM